MQWFADRDFPVWGAFLIGAVGVMVFVLVTDDEATSVGNAVGFAFVPALAGGALAAFLAYRHNRKRRR